MYSRFNNATFVSTLFESILSAVLRAKVCGEDAFLFSEFRIVFVSIITLNELNCRIPAL